MDNNKYLFCENCKTKVWNPEVNDYTKVERPLIAGKIPVLDIEAKKVKKSEGRKTEPLYRCKKCGFLMKLREYKNEPVDNIDECKGSTQGLPFS